MKPQIMNFRTLIEEMKSVASGQSSAPKRASRRIFTSEKAAAEYRGGKAQHDRGLGVESLSAVARLLTPENRKMISYLSTHEVASVAELARQMKRAQSNLSRTIKKFEQLGLVTLVPGEGKNLVPQLNVETLHLEVNVANGRVTLFGVDGPNVAR